MLLFLIGVNMFFVLNMIYFDVLWNLFFFLKGFKSLYCLYLIIDSCVVSD